MPKKEQLLTPAAAAKAANVSASSVRNWIRAEASLKTHVVMRKGQRMLRPGAVQVIKNIKERRLAAVSPALRKAWAAVSKKAKSKKTAPRPAPAKGAPAPPQPAPAQAKALTGEQAARALGIGKPTLYERLKRLGIKPPGRSGFTPELMQKLRGEPTAPAPAARKAAPKPVVKPKAKAVLSATAPSGLEGAMAQIQHAIAHTREEARAEARSVLLVVLAKVQAAITQLEG